MLSSFAFNKTAASIKSACFRAGVEVVEVNPAYTSVIGAVSYARSKGIPTHQGAAYAIARRGLRMSERPTCRVAVVPARKGGHVTFALPVRTRAKHVLSFWSNVKTALYDYLRVRRAVEDAAPWKSPKADFSTSLGNPARAAGISTSPTAAATTTASKDFDV
jgi:hypothetical protein